MKKLNIIYILLICIVHVSLNSCKNNSNAQESKSPVPQQEDKENTTLTEEEPKPTKYPTLNIKPNDQINSPIEIKVNSEGVWFASEGELGWIQLIDDKGNELAKGILSADGDWMKSGPVMFSATLTFDSKNIETGKLIVHNNPGEGDGDEAGESIHFEIPVIF
ncbi:hypothetical protein [Aquimarina sp. AU58]|uniref:hypothetical protein n=1 Tax=Aquimarina sp. AU58 TaxID=1874112 RepID=UPI000D648F9C|nr:hypothetical protein [Aquimarina sp. AU58]